MQDKYGKARTRHWRVLTGGHAVEAPGHWYLACRYRCRLSSTHVHEHGLCKRSLRPLTLQAVATTTENGRKRPHKSSRASGEVCFNEATWDSDTVPCMQREPMTAPGASRFSVTSIVHHQHSSKIFVCLFVCINTTPLALQGS